MALDKVKHVCFNKNMNNEYMRNYMLQRYHQYREWAISYLGGKCAKCGSTEELEFDHIDPKSKEIRADKLWTLSKEKSLQELRKCQLLCKLCHTKKTIAERGQQDGRIIHGTLSSYRYCKCPQCKKAHTDYMREYKRNRKKFASFA